MTNAYVISTRGNQEFAVCDELREAGLQVQCPKVRRSKTLKNRNRSVRHYPAAMLPGYIFAIFPAVYFRDVKELRDVRGLWPIGAIEWRLRVKPFLEAAQAEYDAALAAEAGSEALSPYTAGDALKILDGPLTGLPAKFTEAVKRAHDDHARIRAEVDLMGQTTTVDLDPANVRKAI